ncbi:ribonuclease H-like domain-containing protein [Tanacetum coccineum]
MIELPKSHPKETYKKDLDCEMVMVNIPRCMSWLCSTGAYNEPISTLSMMNNKVGNTSSQVTPEFLPSFEEYTPPATYPKEIENTLGAPMEEEPLDQTKLEDIGLTNHNISLSSREVPVFCEPKPQPQPLPTCLSLDVSLGDERGPEPPIKPHSRKAHLLEDKHIPSVGVFDEVTCEALKGNSRNSGLIGEETRRRLNPTRLFMKLHFATRGDGVVILSDAVKDSIYERGNAIHERQKARLVAKGYTQSYEIATEEIFSTVADIKAIRIILAITAFYDYEIWQMDVKIAFLNGHPRKDVYMVQTEGSVNSKHPRKVCFFANEVCLEILERVDMLNCKSYHTPVATKLDVNGRMVSEPTLYSSLAGSLQFLTFRRPDLSYVVQYVCLFMHDPWEQHLAALKRILQNCAALVYYDNVSVVYMYSNPVQHERTKHIEIDIHFVRDQVASGLVRVLHVPSRYQFGDIFTKDFPYVLFDEFQSSMSICASLAPTVGAGAVKRISYIRPMHFKDSLRLLRLRQNNTMDSSEYHYPGLLQVDTTDQNNLLVRGHDPQAPSPPIPVDSCYTTRDIEEFLFGNN